VLLNALGCHICASRGAFISNPVEEDDLKRSMRKQDEPACPL
jgi:hypothetical protein